MTTEAKPRIDPGLTEDLADLCEKSHGDTAIGEIEEIQPDGSGGILVKAKAPTGATVKERFKYPKDASSRWRFNRFADAYGTGINNLHALEGASVECYWHAADSTWAFSVPDEPPSLGERIASLYDNKIIQGILVFPGLFIVSPAIALVMLLEGGIGTITDGEGRGYFTALFGAVLWTCIAVAVYAFFRL